MTYATTLLLGYLAGRLHRWRRVRAQIRAAIAAGRQLERNETRRVLTEWVTGADEECQELAERAEYGGRRA